MQNNYNVAHRGDDPLIDALAAQDIGYVPYFPLGGFSPLQSRALQAVADELGQAAMTVALAWLPRRSPNVLLIPARPLSRTCARTSPQVRCSCPTRQPRSWTRSVTDDGSSGKAVLIIGASRGLGLALAEQYLLRGWWVTATVRGPTRTRLHELAVDAGGRLTVETLDMTVPEQVDALRFKVAGSSFDLLFVNAAVTNRDVPVMDVSTETFVDVMVTNALSPLRVVEALHDAVAPDGTIAVMSSHQGSVALNDRGGHEVYRASKSALNQLMRSYAARQRSDPRTLLLIAPGWVRTELGGPHAALSVDTSVPAVVDVVQAHTGEGGLQFLDYQDRVVPW